MNSPLSHEGPARRRLPAKAQRLAGLPLETSLAPLRTHLASPCKDYLCGSSNPVSEKKKRRERTTKEKKIGKNWQCQFLSFIFKCKSGQVSCAAVIFKQSSGSRN